MLLLLLLFSGIDAACDFTPHPLAPKITNNKNYKFQFEKANFPWKLFHFPAKSLSFKKSDRIYDVWNRRRGRGMGFSATNWIRDCCCSINHIHRGSEWKCLFKTDVICLLCFQQEQGRTEPKQTKWYECRWVRNLIGVLF